MIVGAPNEDSNATGVDGNPEINSTRDTGAGYLFTRSGTAWTQQAYLKASHLVNFDFFGASVAVSDDTAVVGARYEDRDAAGVEDFSASNAGAAYAFTRNGAGWTPRAYLKASNAGEEDYFGHAVAVSGDTVVVGAYREDSNATTVNGNQGNNSASSAGAAYIFTGFGPVVLTPLEQWRQLYFGTTANTGDAADGFDFDKDGLVNLLEWATGTHPKQANSYHPALVRNGANLGFTYLRSLTAFNAGTGYSVEWSGTLVAGSWQTTRGTQSVLSTAGDVQTVLATVPSGPERPFLRLRVTAP